MSKEYLLSPSILSADLSSLADALSFIEQNGGDAIHIDVMDGHFVPEITFGEVLIRAAKKLTTLPLDVHLMTCNAEQRVDSYIDAGADWITFHSEAVIHAHRLACHIKQSGRKAGISIVPSTPVASIVPMLEYVDFVLIMSVDPGYSGQSFIESSISKLQQLVALKKEMGLGYSISIDGGVSSQNIGLIVRSGADIVVSGSSFFKGTLFKE